MTSGNVEAGLPTFQRPARPMAIKCWICGEPATTGEHIPKASALRDLFGVVTQDRPLYYSADRVRNKRLQSIDSSRLKLKTLCAECNSNKTQPMDRAWDRLMNYLEVNTNQLSTNSRIRRYRLFPYHSREQMLQLHLYFVKLFGCVISAMSAPLNIGSFAEAINRRHAHPNVYVGLGKRSWLPELKFAGPSDLHCDLDGANCVFSVWSLDVGAWQFQIMYAADGQAREGLVNAWNPLRSYAIVLKDFPQ